MHSFTHLLIEAKSKRSIALKPYEDTHMILDSVDVFSHIQFNYDHFPPLRLRMRPAIFLLYNNEPQNVRWPVDEGDVSTGEEKSPQVVEHAKDVQASILQTSSSGEEKPKKTNDEAVSVDEENEEGYGDASDGGDVAAKSSLPAEGEKADDNVDSITPRQTIS